MSLFDSILGDPDSMAAARALIEGDLEAARATIGRATAANTSAAQSAASPLRALAETLRRRAEQGGSIEARALLTGLRDQAQANLSEARLASGSLQAQRLQTTMALNSMIAQGVMSGYQARQQQILQNLQASGQLLAQAGQFTTTAVSRNLDALASFESNAAGIMSQARIAEAQQRAQANPLVSMIGSGLAAMATGGAFAAGGIFTKMFASGGGGGGSNLHSLFFND